MTSVSAVTLLLTLLGVGVTTGRGGLERIVTACTLRQLCEAFSCRISYGRYAANIKYTYYY